ncbi:MAG: hypothetical protein RIB46_12695 [Pseudomonadales bacterium]
MADGRYRIVDVRQLGGDALVYAEAVLPAGRTPNQRAAAPARAAFHYQDIAALLEAAPGGSI